MLAITAKVASEAMETGWQRQARRIEKALNEIALPPATHRAVMNIIADMPETGVKEGIARIISVIDGNTADPLLTSADLGAINVTSLTPQAKNKIATAANRGATADEFEALNT